MFDARPRPFALLSAALTLIALGVPAAVAASDLAKAVSPGATERPSEIGSACPTFSWSAVAGAAGHELAVLDLTTKGEPVVVLRHPVEGSASSWTPSLAECLKPGGSFAWTVRALDASGRGIGSETGWSAPKRFTIRAVPTADEVAAAIDLLRRWQSQSTGGSETAPATSRADESLSSRAVEVAGASAIRGENPATSGTSFGVWGQSSSTSGAGLVGVNTASGPDLVLDGVANGEADTLVTQAGIDRASASSQSFTIQNSGGGGMRLYVGASQVSVAGHGHAGTDITSGLVADARIAATIARDSEILPAVLAGDGPGSGLDADTVDGFEGAAFSRPGHAHAGEEITSGTVADARIASTLTRDSEVMTVVLANDGTGSGVDADSLDGSHAASFSPLVHVHAGESITSGTVADARVDSALTRDSEVMTIVLYYDGPASGLNADLLDGLHSQNFQIRVTGVCAGGETLQGINADGTVVCTALSGPPTISTLYDTGWTAGMDTSIAIDGDGVPVISHAVNGGAGTRLAVSRCGDASCSTTPTLSLVDPSPNSSGLGSSIAIGADRLPVISYQDQSATALKVVKCGNATCSPGSATITTVDAGSDVGAWTSLAIGDDGRPVIAYYDTTAGVLKVAKCNDAACAGNNETITTVDNPANDVGQRPSLAIGTDGFPVISYYDVTARALKVAKCNDAACAGNNETITTVDDPADDVGEHSSLAIGADGLPVIAYLDDTAGALKVAKCNDAACSGGDETISTADDPVTAVGRYLSLAIGTDGLPVISYYSSGDGDLKVARCNDPACSGGNESIVFVDLTDDVGRDTSIAIGTDGFPVISYQSYTASSLKVAKCHTRSCMAP